MWENGKKILCSKLLKPWSQTTPEIYPTAGYVTNRSMERHIKMFGGGGLPRTVVLGPDPPRLQNRSISHKPSPPHPPDAR